MKYILFIGKQMVVAQLVTEMLVIDDDNEVLRIIVPLLF